MNVSLQLHRLSLGQRLSTKEEEWCKKLHGLKAYNSCEIKKDSYQPRLAADNLVPRVLRLFGQWLVASLLATNHRPKSLRTLGTRLTCEQLSNIKENAVVVEDIQMKECLLFHLRGLAIFV